MKKALLLALIPLAALAATYGPYQADVGRIIDGDTFEATIHLWPGLSMDTRVRVAVIDTPETRAAPECEKALGAKATAFTAAFLSGGKVVLSDLEIESFGRALAKVTVEGKGDLSAELLKAGLARVYVKGDKTPWCE